MPTWRTRERWTQDDGAAALAALKRSGLSVASFAAAQGIDAQRLYGWRRRLSSAAEFVELTPGSTLAVRDSARGFEVMLRSGHVVRMPESFDVEAFRRLVDVLEGQC